MITDRMDYLIDYIPEQYKRCVRDFLAQVSPDMEEKRYEISGSHVFAKVMRYDTRESKNCKIEAHNRYIDIQGSITGAEGISVFNRENLRIVQDYDRKEDNMFFNQNDQIPYVASRNMPGIFSMIFPHEAHRPQETVKGYKNHVKKFVIKLETAEYGR